MYKNETFQVCYIHMKLESFEQVTTELVPDIMSMESGVELPQYMIQSWKLNYFKSGKLLEFNIR